MSEKPLTPWIIANEDGRILAGHCDCMAGLGETCSHVASLLWVIGVGVETRESLTVTQKSAYWILPPAVKSVPYAPVKDISFIGKKRKVMNSATKSSDHSATETPSPLKKKACLCAPTEQEQYKFFNSLSTCIQSGAKPAVLALVPPHCDEYVPTSLAPELPTVLSDLYKTEYLKLRYNELLQKACSIQIAVTTNQVLAVEAKTKNQAGSRLWFRMRTGRITASKFKAACRTDPASPSISLIMAICHPETLRFCTSATKWGCQHEKTALAEYKQSNSDQHENLVVSDSGLFISIEYPFIGASPDGLVECSCCGQGICEIKVSVYIYSYCVIEHYSS